MNPHQQVGKTFANWTPNFANWIQLANTCQLHSSTNQRVIYKLATWQVGNADNLPTETTDCFYRIIHLFSVGENSPLPTGEVDTPDISRDVYLVLGHRRVVCEVVIQVEVVQ